MASNTGISSHASGSDPTTQNTTFVQADPSNFRAVVQRLTGASEDPSAHKLPLTLPSRLTAHSPRGSASATPAATATTEMGPRKPNFKLHERRHTAKKLELNIGVSEKPALFFNPSLSPSPSSSYSPYGRPRGGGLIVGGEMVMASSPVSPLEVMARTPREEEEIRVIAEKGFYLHPSPLSTPRGSDPPQLLPLFPLHSPES